MSDGDNGKIIHISRLPESEKAREQKLLDSLDKYQKRYLSKYECGRCEKTLLQSGCMTYGSCPTCSEQARIDRINQDIDKTHGEDECQT